MCVILVCSMRPRPNLFLWLSDTAFSGAYANMCLGSRAVCTTSMRHTNTTQEPFRAYDRHRLFGEGHRQDLASTTAFTKSLFNLYMFVLE